METHVVQESDESIAIQVQIKTREGVVLGMGHAQEFKGSSTINRTSWLENCETSAVGRALANMGWSGGEYASADELVEALAQQNEAYEQALWIMAMGQPISFIEFIHGLDEEESASAFNGAPDGRKTHFKNRWRELSKQGFDLINDVVIHIQEMLKEGDSFAVLEALGELNEFETDRVKHLLDPEEVHQINQIVQENDNE